jgi:hypothetical protein
VLRGLVIEGSANRPWAPRQVDALAIVGPEARRKRVEQTLIVGPTCGDAVSVKTTPGSLTPAAPPTTSSWRAASPAPGTRA